MSNEIQNRRELIFLYDVKDANPNGDPDDSNRPRTDHEGYNIVTDVRLKRTIRDYWLNHKKEEDGMQVLVKRVEDVADGTVKSMANLITDALDLPDKISKTGETKQRIRQEIPATFIDVKFFGAAITLAGANVSITGPVQFGIGRSLNKPRIVSHTITTSFSAGDEKQAGTFGETHVVDYSLLCFGGVISETTALDTGLAEDDLPKLWEGIWKGTKNLNTRSKFNHSPRLLISVVSDESEFQIGGLYRLMKVHQEEIDDIRSEKDVILDVTDFIHRLNEFENHVQKIEIFEDTLLNYQFETNEVTSLQDFLEDQGFEVQLLNI